MSYQILEGVKILDISCVVAAPMSASFLSDFGADVIRVELPKGESMRTTAYNKVLNRNKRCITMDFHKQGVLDTFFKLVEWADVLIANFRPETLKRFGIDYDECVKRNPKIIYLSFSAYGRTGPKANVGGYARVAEAYAGLTYITGWPDRAPSLSGSWIADGIGGIYSAYLISLALLHREKTGEGQLIDLGLYEPLFRILDNMPIGYSKNGTIVERQGNMHQAAVPNNMYETADGEWLSMPLNFSSFVRFLKAFGKSELLEDERYGTAAGRKANKYLVDGMVAELVRTKTAEEMLQLALDYGFACGRANSIKDIFEDEHMWARGSLVKVYDDKTGDELVINGVCGIFSKTPGELKWLCHDIGEDNEAVYRQMLGMSEEEYDRLKTDGAI